MLGQWSSSNWALKKEIALFTRLWNDTLLGDSFDQRFGRRKFPDPFSSLDFEKHVELQKGYCTGI